MPIPLETLLAPISPAHPCGPDVSYDPEFQELEVQLLGKPETQFSPAEPPEWPQIRARSLGLLERSKHLRLIVTLAASVVRLEGLAGFRDALALLAGVIEQYWEPLYPLLDADDENDPTERLNIIATLTAPIGQAGDPYRTLEALRAAPLSASAKMGRFSLHEVQRSQTGEAEGGKPAVSAAEVQASFRDTPPEQLAAAQAAVEQAQTLVKRLAELLSERVGSHRLPNFDPLNQTLREMQKLLASHTGGSAPAEADAGPSGTAEAASTPSLSTGGGAGFSGGVGTREEVVRALDAVIRYYAQHEPSSPIPLLLERAKRMVPMDFLNIMQDWAPEAVAQVNLIAGIRAE